MIYIHYDPADGEILNAYDENCKNIPQPNIAVTDEENRQIHMHWKKKGKVIDGKLTLVDIPMTVADFDKVMEEYLTETRVARGYTTREPTDYLNSEQARWKQDAADWIAFRDAVMLYVLDLMNTYESLEKIPTLDEFKAGLPKIKWNAE